MQVPSPKKNACATYILVVASFLLGMYIKDPVVYVWTSMTHHSPLYTARPLVKKKAPIRQHKRSCPKDLSRLFAEADMLFGRDTNSTKKIYESTLTQAGNSTACLVCLTKALRRKRQYRIAELFYHRMLSLQHGFSTSPC